MSATALGVVLGPGTDAGPLIALWVAGFVHLASRAELHYDKEEAISAVATIVAGLSAWFISGKIAQVVAGALVAGGLSMAGVTGGATLILAAFATLSLNATINALFTFRFLRACAMVIEDHAASGAIFLRAFVNVISDGLLSIAEIPNDLVKTAKLMCKFW